MDIKDAVKEKYARAAIQVTKGEGADCASACCGPSCSADPITSNLYERDQVVELLKGEIERIPLPDNSVDVIISNCVINLSGDKERVFAEAFRVLRPGGRLAVSDIVVRGEVPADLRHSIELWVGCVAGALEEREYVKGLAQAGFDSIGVEPTRVYRVADAGEFLSRVGIGAAGVAPP